MPRARLTTNCRTRLLVGLCLLLGLVALPTKVPRAQGRLQRVRVASWDDRFRVVLDLSTDVAYRDRVLTEPHRIAIDIPQTVASSLALPETRDDLVRRIRFNQLNGPTAQVVLDLHQAPSFNIFTLPTDGERPFRIVCDVFRPLREGGAPKKTSWVVILDPGHGGKDPGTVNRRYDLQEKEIVLDVCQRLRRVLAAERGVEAHLTRETDQLIGLRERVTRAEDRDGDVFVSIHVNGCRHRGARGAEVFFLSLRGATDAATRELAALENSAVPTEDPMLGEIAGLPFAVDLIQTDTIQRSSLLSETILAVLGDSGLAAARGVKQANFAVLRSCRMPSTLVELGFISNPGDAKQLAKASHRQALAETIARGLLEFRRLYARGTGTGAQVSERP